MSTCCDGHSLCDQCQKIKDAAWEREHLIFRKRVSSGESIANMMVRLAAPTAIDGIGEP